MFWTLWFREVTLCWLIFFIARNWVSLLVLRLTSRSYFKLEFDINFGVWLFFIRPVRPTWKLYDALVIIAVSNHSRRLCYGRSRGVSDRYCLWRGIWSIVRFHPMIISDLILRFPIHFIGFEYTNIVGVCNQQLDQHNFLSRLTLITDV